MKKNKLVGIVLSLIMMLIAIAFTYQFWQDPIIPPQKEKTVLVDEVNAKKIPQKMMSDDAIMKCGTGKCEWDSHINHAKRYINKYRYIKPLIIGD